MKLLVIAAACLLAVYSVAGSDGDVQVRKKRAPTISSMSGSLNVAAGVVGNVATLIGITTSAIPLMSVFTGLFAVIGGLLNNDKDYWKRLEDRMKEIAEKEVTDYHIVMRDNFIKNIKNSLSLYNSLPQPNNGPPNQQKITQGIALSNDINNGGHWITLDVGKNPQKMMVYYMEVIALDIGLLYSMAAVYGKGHWITLDTRLKQHIAATKAGAQKILDWKMQDKNFECQRSQCNNGYKACGIRNTQRCVVKVPCTTGKDLTDPMQRRVSYQQRPTGRTAYRMINDYFIKTKKNTNDCNWFKAEIRSKTQTWLNNNVYRHTKLWEELQKRAQRNLGR